MKTFARAAALLLCVLVILTGCAPISVDPEPSFDLASVPAFSGDPYVVIDDGQPGFSDEDLTDQSFETYSELDALGRCGVAYACVGQDLMPTEERGSISSVKPSGWINAEYDSVDGRYLYNRCHLIGFQLTGENANEQNLITGTRFLNTEGMLPFENMVADFIKETDYHVLYRVTPIFEGDNLVASGVHMEALSVEDSGEGICFNIYAYNAQPGITIDYATGQSWLTGEQPDQTAPEEAGSSSAQDGQTYILNTSSRKFHDPDCGSVSTIKDANKEVFQGSREELIREGYAPCGQCKP